MALYALAIFRRPADARRPQSTRWLVGVALLASVAVQSVSGLFASDEIDTDGPFVAHVSDATVKLMTRVHHWNENVLVTLIGLHVAAVLLYLVARHDDLSRRCGVAASAWRRQACTSPAHGSRLRFAICRTRLGAGVVGRLGIRTGDEACELADSADGEFDPYGEHQAENGDANAARCVLRPRFLARNS